MLAFISRTLLEIPDHLKMRKGRELGEGEEIQEGLNTTWQRVDWHALQGALGDSHLAKGRWSGHDPASWHNGIMASWCMGDGGCGALEGGRRMVKTEGCYGLNGTDALGCLGSKPQLFYLDKGALMRSVPRYVPCSTCSKDKAAT